MQKMKTKLGILSHFILLSIINNIKKNFNYKTQ